MIEWVAGVALAGAAGWILGRRGGKRAPRPGPVERAWTAASQEGPPDLWWLARAHGALGVWLRRTERAVVQAATQVSVAEPLVRTIEGRLAALQGPGGRTGVERLDQGALAFAASDDLQAAMLLPPETPAAPAVRDLEALLGLVRTRAQLEAGTGSTAPSRQEALDSVAVRLAIDLERQFGVEAAVAIRRPRGVQVTATSVRADPRLHRVVAVPGSAADRTARGELPGAVHAFDPLGVLPPDRRLRERQALVLPIGVPDQPPVGAVIVWPPGRAELPAPVRSGIQSVVQGVAPRLAEAVTRLELMDQAQRDPLTGLRNRRGLTEAMAHVDLEQGVLMVLDLDRFKVLNDTLGHPAGDAALKAVAGILEDVVRDSDVAARVGGEEFAVWMPGGGLADGQAAAERIRAEVAGAEWSWQGRRWPLSASLGVAAWPETSRSRDNLMAQADAALYRAKAGGRNRVEVAG